MHFLSKLRRPSPAMMVAIVALFFALGGGAYAAVKITTSQIADNAVTHAKLAKNSVWQSNLGKGVVGLNNLNKSLAQEIAKSPKPSSGSTGAQGPQGPAGPKGATGAPGAPGTNGLNPATAVNSVPSIASSSGSNPNPDSGDAGDAGFYFSGNGAGGSASITGGELVLTGAGVDSNTIQGGIGIAKAFNNVPLSHLDGVSYSYTIGNANGSQAPIVHVTVTGLTNDSHFASGFANLVYSPALNGAGVSVGQAYLADAFLPSAKWYSTTESNINNTGGQNNPQPLSYFVSNDPNATIGQISLDNGGSSGGSGSFAASADDLVIGMTGSISRYDFGS